MRIVPYPIGGANAKRVLYAFAVSTGSARILGPTAREALISGFGDSGASWLCRPGLCRPGVDEKDIKVSLDDNQLVISGGKKAESKKEEKDWHVEERSYGSFYRSISLPFESAEGAVDTHFDKGVLHLTLRP